MKIPSGATIERNRALTSRLRRAVPHFTERAMEELHAGRAHRTDFKVPRMPSAAASTRRSEASCRTTVIRDRQLSSLSAHTLECQPEGRVRHPRSLRRRGAEHAHLRENVRQVQGHRHQAYAVLILPSLWHHMYTGKESC